MGDWLADSALPKYVHAGKEVARAYPLAGIEFDVELAAYIINPGGRNIALDDLTERFLGVINAEQEETLFDSFDGMGAISILQLVPVLTKELEAREMFSLMKDLEIPVLISPS